MELRHLRFFCSREALNFTKGLRNFGRQPALTGDAGLENEMAWIATSQSARRDTHGEGKLFLEEVRGVLRRTDESVEKVRAWLAANMAS